jgi:hypothetical protein
MALLLLIVIVVAAATPLCLLELVATFLRLAAVLTVAVNCLSELFLGLVDTLLALAVVITRPRARHATSQQQYSLGISSQLVKCFDQNFQFDFATEHLPVLGALSHFAFGLIPRQFRTAHPFGQNCSFHFMESAVQDCSGHWSFVNRQRISAGISLTRSLSVDSPTRTCLGYSFAIIPRPQPRPKIGRSQSPCESGY